MAEDHRGKVIALFDVDGTLTPARLVRFVGKNGLVTSFFVVVGPAPNPTLFGFSSSRASRYVFLRLGDCRKHLLR
jgi:hypothetical protein